MKVQYCVLNCFNEQNNYNSMNHCELHNCIKMEEYKTIDLQLFIIFRA